MVNSVSSPLPPTLPECSGPAAPPSPPRPRSTRIDKRKGRPERKHLGFIACDGEGEKDAEGHERYWLLRVGEEEIQAAPGDRLTTSECLRFLFTHGRKQGYFLVGFGLSYDFDHILRDLTDEQFAATRKAKEGAWYTDGRHKYQIKRVKGKFLQVYRWPMHRLPDQKGEKVVLYDCVSFFQCGFHKVICNWDIGTEEERAFIGEMKGLRGEFASVDKDAIRRYNDLECRLLADLMRKFDAMVQESIGVRLRSWHGPGSLAKTALKKFGIAEQIKVWQQADLPEKFRDAVCRAFFGGWFQLFRVGHVGPCRQGDINSAYPDQTRNLPALGGTVTHTKEYDPNAYAVWHVVWDIAEQSAHNPLPYRTQDGRILRPPWGNGWYWQDEVRAALEFHGDKVKVLEGWVYTPPTDELPFKDLVESLYAVRLSLGKTTAGYPIKLFLNSIYGVLAQAPIHGEQALGCLMWAGMITSGTRAKLYRAMMQDPEAAVFVATDGLLTEGTLDLPFSKALGEWDLEEYTSAEVYQPGIYRLNGPKPKEKVRGIRTEEPPDWSAMAREWLSNGCRGALEVECRERYVSRDLAIHWGHQPYRWTSEKKLIVLHPGNGFQGVPDNPNNVPWLTYDLFGREQFLQQVSAPYDKHLPFVAGVRDAMVMLREEENDD